MLILCKPFCSNFSKFPTFIKKINCFYLMQNEYVMKALELEKLVNNKDSLELMLAWERTSEDCSGFTAECIYSETSSLLGGGSDKKRGRSTELYYRVLLLEPFGDLIYLKENARNLYEE